MNNNFYNRKGNIKSLMKDIKERYNRSTDCIFFLKRYIYKLQRITILRQMYIMMA
ncbi:hypothetical protein bcgnr5378_64250 [Bacillus cereus]